MKSTIIEGIPDSKIKRLKKHLLKVEKLANAPLLEEPYGQDGDCPILNFSPKVKKCGLPCLFGFGCLDLHDTSWGSEWFFSVYYSSDYKWWRKLEWEQRQAITRHIQQWIKEGKKL